MNDRLITIFTNQEYGGGKDYDFLPDQQTPNKGLILRVSTSFQLLRSTLHYFVGEEIVF